MAADLPVKTPHVAAPAVVAYNWTGCYVGVGYGYGVFDLNTQERVTATGANINAPLDQGGRGWLGTVNGGCDYQFASSFIGLPGSVLIGIFADGDWSNIHGNFTGAGGAVGIVSGDLKLKNSWAAGGRLGYLITPSLLTYLSGGWTQAKFSQVDYVLPSGAPFGVSAPGTTYNGWFLGSGFEYAIALVPGLFWKTEYRWSSYTTKDLPEFTTATGVLTGTLVNSHPYVQTVRSSLVWRFNLGSR